MALDGGWIIDLDIRSYFDSVDHSHLRHFLEQRVRDGVIGRAVGKWLNAGVMEDGAVSHPERGTPHGGVISPILSNLYLHEVLDLWFEHTPRSVLDTFAAVQMIDVEIPTTDGRQIRLTRYTEPEPELRLLLDTLRLKLPAQPPPKITAAQAQTATPM